MLQTFANRGVCNYTDRYQDACPANGDSNMHEVAIADQLLESAVSSMHENGGNRITRIRVDIGHLSGVVPSALEFAFSCLKENTPAESAVLEINCVSERYVCQQCSKPVERNTPEYVCPFCGSGNLTVSQGYELHLSSLEIETDDEQE
jgi:hydrogenase nickel incorporation protein HypA/HybF